MMAGPPTTSACPLMNAYEGKPVAGSIQAAPAYIAVAEVPIATIGGVVGSAPPPNVTRGVPAGPAADPSSIGAAMKRSSASVPLAAVTSAPTITVSPGLAAPATA